MSAQLVATTAQHHPERTPCRRTVVPRLPGVLALLVGQALGVRRSGESVRDISGRCDA